MLCSGGRLLDARRKATAAKAVGLAPVIVDRAACKSELLTCTGHAVRRREAPGRAARGDSCQVDWIISCARRQRWRNGAAGGAGKAAGAAAAAGDDAGARAWNTSRSVIDPQSTSWCLTSQVFHCLNMTFAIIMQVFKWDPGCRRPHACTSDIVQSISTSRPTADLPLCIMQWRRCTRRCSRCSPPRPPPACCVSCASDSMTAP